MKGPTTSHSGFSALLPVRQTGFADAQPNGKPVVSGSTQWQTSHGSTQWQTSHGSTQWQTSQWLNPMANQSVAQRKSERQL